MRRTTTQSASSCSSCCCLLPAVRWLSFGLRLQHGVRMQLRAEAAHPTGVTCPWPVHRRCNRPEVGIRVLPRQAQPRDDTSHKHMQAMRTSWRLQSQRAWHPHPLHTWKPVQTSCCTCCICTYNHSSPYSSRCDRPAGRRYCFKREATGIDLLQYIGLHRQLLIALNQLVRVPV